MVAGLSEAKAETRERNARGSSGKSNAGQRGGGGPQATGPQYGETVGELAGMPGAVQNAIDQRKADAAREQGLASRGTNGLNGSAGGPPRGKRPATSATVTPTKPFGSIVDEPPGIATGLKGLIDTIAGNYDSSDISGYSGNVQKELGGTGPNAQGNTGGGKAYTWQDQQGNPLPNAPVSPSNPIGPNGISGDAAWEQLMGQLQGAANASGLYYLKQWGLLPNEATDAGQWGDALTREYDRIFDPLARSSIFTNDMLSDNVITDAEYEQALNQARTRLPAEFGNNALLAEQDRVRNSYRNALDQLGWRDQVTNAFGDTADDSIIDSIYQSQYDPAFAQINNQFKRGVFNPAGYNYALNKLNTQGELGRAKLNEIGQQQRSSAASGINSWIDTIYGNAAQTRLGQNFDPAPYGNELTSRLGTATSGLGDKISSAAPNIFDTDTVVRDAGTVQGVTSRGSLLDTLANRSGGRRANDRGIGSTGAF